MACDGPILELKTLPQLPRILAITLNSCMLIPRGHLGASMATSCHYFRLRRPSLRVERGTRMPEIMEPKPSHSGNAFTRHFSFSQKPVTKGRDYPGQEETPVTTDTF